MSVCLRVDHTGKLCKTAEPIEMLFGGQICVSPKSHALGAVQLVPPGEYDTCKASMRAVAVISNLF